MRDLTAHLMGDPGPHPRRDPTEQERVRLTPLTRLS